MAVHQKLSEIGWFYHAPEPPRSKHESQGIPLASQIPGLNDLSSIPYDDEPRPLFRDTDTKYIRMAKMGGREDLLRHREPKAKSKEPKPYPRNDWFYLEDNNMAENNVEANKPWEFRLPEYMVHDEHKPFGDDYDYKNDPDGLIYWKKGRVVPGGREIKHITRAATVEHVHTAPPMPSAVSSKARSARNTQSDAPHSRYPDVPPLYNRDGRPAMNKLLAYGYANEWHAPRDDWYRQVEEQERAEFLAAGHAALQQPKSGKSSHKNMTWNDLKSKSQPTNASRRVMSNTHQDARDKAPFKLSRFENVGSKVNSHRVLPPINQ